MGRGGGEDHSFRSKANPVCLFCSKYYSYKKAAILCELLCNKLNKYFELSIRILHNRQMCMNGNAVRSFLRYPSHDLCMWVAPSDREYGMTGHNFQCFINGIFLNAIVVVVFLILTISYMFVYWEYVFFYYIPSHKIVLLPPYQHTDLSLHTLY